MKSLRISFEMYVGIRRGQQLDTFHFKATQIVFGEDKDS